MNVKVNDNVLVIAGIVSGDLIGPAAVALGDHAAPGDIIASSGGAVLVGGIETVGLVGIGIVFQILILVAVVGGQVVQHPVAVSQLDQLPLGSTAGNGICFL